MPDRMQHPVNCIDWKQASAYCEFAGGRLPTEEEWLLAAGRADGRRYPWGDAAPSAGIANLHGTDGDHDRPLYPEQDGWEFTAPVGSFPKDKSPFGLLDMGGNIREWTSTRSQETMLVLGAGYSSRVAYKGHLRFRPSAFPSLEGPWLGARCVRPSSR
jgi:formylglycine-generating enzyme required for sulfatase activity